MTLTYRKIEKVSADDAIKATFKLANPKLKKLLINLAKYPKDDSDYRDFKNELEGFCKIFSFIISTSDVEDVNLVLKAEKYLLLRQQLIIYEKSDPDFKFSNFMKVCEVASLNLDMEIPELILKNIRESFEDDDYLDF